MKLPTPAIISHLLEKRHVLWNELERLCQLYGVSRKTAYKWIDRYLRLGPAGLEERSRRPRHAPNETPSEIAAAFLEIRRYHPSWGAKKLLKIVRKRHSRWHLPCRSTVCDILSRHGMVPKRRQRRRIGHPGKPNSLILAPNDLWSADFKGQFKTGDGIYCYPLTVTDGFSRYLLGCQALYSTAVNGSRYLLGCQALYSTAVNGVKPVFSRLFQEYGLPKRIRTDNGVPFATNTLARLSSLSAWWVRIGVLPELIEPGKPQQNGRHERMHRTLKAEATRPAAGSLPAQQRPNLTKSAPTRPWTRRLQLPSMNPLYAKCLQNFPHSYTPIASKSVMSVPMGEFAGSRTGSTFPSSALGSMWDWKKSTMVSGTYTSDHSNSADYMNGKCESRTNMVD
jgi:transposase InsO family protein